MELLKRSADIMEYVKDPRTWIEASFPKDNSSELRWPFEKSLLKFFCNFMQQQTVYFVNVTSVWFTPVFARLRNTEQYVYLVTGNNNSDKVIKRFVIIINESIIFIFFIIKLTLILLIDNNCVFLINVQFKIRVFKNITNFCFSVCFVLHFVT